MRPRTDRAGRWRGTTAALALIAVLALISVGAAFTSLPPSTSRQELPSFEAVRASYRPSDLVVLDRHGEPVGAMRIDHAERRGEWVPLHAVSPALVQAVLLSEDRRFREHGGVDWRAAAGAAWAWVRRGETRGASTVSMQLASLIDDSLKRPGDGRSLGQKVAQARAAWRLESAWSKDQIFEAYLNLVAFRGELRGVDAVSRAMFGKHPHGLDAEESAVAAALLRGPNARPARVAARACAVLRAAGQPEACGGLGHRMAAWLAATSRPAADAPVLAPHFARAVASAAHGQEPGTLHSTLDAPLQRHVLHSVKRQLAGMEQSRLTDAAVVVLDNRTGDVLAYVGSSGEHSAAPEVDHARARRQAGSTLKPFLYALALERRYLTAASLLDDAPLDVGTAGGLYVPQNYDRRHAGPVSVRTALASSLNIPAVRTLMLVGPERFADRLRTLGLPLEHDGDHYGYSLSLGSADVDPLSLTNAYRALANGGLSSRPRMLRRGPKEGGGAFQAAEELPDDVGGQAVQVVDAGAAWIVGDILADRRARARTFGLENALATRHWTAVKTGTSKDMRDNWCLGWSDRYTVGVWVGNSQGQSMRDVSGVTAAAPIWHDVMSFLHDGSPGAQMPPPDTIVQEWVRFADALEAARSEYFLPGTLITRVEPASRDVAERPRIASPLADTVVALDPDIPIENQRLTLRAAGSAGQESLVRWHVDGRFHAEGAHAYWHPRPGRHRIELADAYGVVLDRVTVVVRGMPHVSSPR